MNDCLDIVGLGTVVVDHLVVLPGHPPMDTKTTVVEDRFQVGGPVPTALVLLQRWGWRCAFVGCWGDDAFGQMVRDDLRREGVAIDHCVQSVGGRTGFAHVWIDGETGSRTVACYRPPAPTGLSIDAIAASGARVLHLDGWPGEEALEAAKCARRSGMKVALDTGSPKPGMEQLIGEVDWLNCPRRFIQQFLGVDDVSRAIGQLRAMGPSVVTVTDGVHGATLGTAKELVHQPAKRVHAVDTTGAGDVFCGAMIHGLMQGWTPRRALVEATGAAAIQCRTLGNRAGLPARPSQVALQILA